MSDDQLNIKPEHMKRIADALLNDRLPHKVECPHKFDGKVWYSEDGRSGSVTCSRCGLPEMFFDMWRLV